MVSGAGEDVGLPTETETQSIDVETENATTVYKVGDTFTSEGLVIKEAVVKKLLETGYEGEIVLLTENYATYATVTKIHRRRS